MLTGHFAEKPTRGQSGRRTGQLADKSTRRPRIFLLNYGNHNPIDCRKCSIRLCNLMQITFIGYLNIFIHQNTR